MPGLPEGEFRLPLFPLPNVVFFPKTRLPLHVFEPRYRQMVEDAVEGEERIGIVLLEPGWEGDYYGAPPVHRVGTLGSIEHIIKLDDGRYNMILKGLARFRILEQITAEPYRVARAELVPERTGSPDTAYAMREWLVELALRYLEFMPSPNQVPELRTVSLGELANALVMSLPLEVEDKQQFLEIDDLIHRAEQIGEVLKNRLETLEFLAPFRTGNEPANN